MIYLVIAYLVYIIGFVIYSLLALYHLNEFGFVGDASRTVIVIYSTISLFIISFSFILLFTSGGS